MSTSSGPGVAPWIPRTLASFDVSKLVYVVVDELESDRVGLCISPWPVIDSRGRLRFDLEQTRRVGVHREALEERLARHRRSKRRVERPLRIGDVFAVQLRGRQRPREGTISDPARWMGPPIVDVTRESREVAKLAFHAAVAPLLHPKRDRAVIELAPETGVTLHGPAPRRKRS